MFFPDDAGRVAARSEYVGRWVAPMVRLIRMQLPMRKNSRANIRTGLSGTAIGIRKPRELVPRLWSTWTPSDRAEERFTSDVAQVNVEMRTMRSIQ
jgi:hypothetical protein